MNDPDQEDSGGSVRSLNWLAQQRLDYCEKVIQEGRETFVKVGNALIEIREAKLYRAGYSTFEEYLSKRWGLQRQRAYELMDASQVVNTVSENSDGLPAAIAPPQKEAHAAPLAVLPPQLQKNAWRLVSEVADKTGRKVTAALVETIASVIATAVSTGTPDGETALSAAIVEEAYERAQRQSEHLRRTGTSRDYYLRNTPVKLESWSEFGGEVRVVLTLPGAAFQQIVRTKALAPQYRLTLWVDEPPPTIQGSVSDDQKG